MKIEDINFEELINCLSNSDHNYDNESDKIDPIINPLAYIEIYGYKAYTRELIANYVIKKSEKTDLKIVDEIHNILHDLNFSL